MAKVIMTEIKHPGLRAKAAEAYMKWFSDKAVQGDEKRHWADTQKTAVGLIEIIGKSIKSGKSQDNNSHVEVTAPAATDDHTTYRR